ncbi:hypothetical protein [Paludifilum halophilum]|nr:hypothetical protein [Paludifilum halophilum]
MSAWTYTLSRDYRLTKKAVWLGMAGILLLDAVSGGVAVER